MSDEEVQERPTLPPIRLLFGGMPQRTSLSFRIDMGYLEELALPAHPPVASTLPNLRADLPSHPTQLPRRDDDSRASRPPPTVRKTQCLRVQSSDVPLIAQFRHSSGLELHSGFSTLRSSFVTPTHASMAPGTESSLSRRFSASGHILRVAEPISRARSWSDTMIASPPYPGHAAMKGLPDNYRTASPRTSPRNTPRVHHQALNPYPPDYPVVGGQSLPPPQIGSPGELPNTFAPKYDCPYCGKSFARPSSLKACV